MYSALTNSYEWNQLNGNNALNNKIATILKEGQVVPLDRIPTAMLTFKNKLKSPIMTKMLDAIESGELRLIYAPKIKIPVYLPFILTRSGPHSCIGYVFLNNLEASCASDNDEIFLNVRKLKVSMESTYIAMQIANMGDSPKLKSSAIIRSGSKIYSAIISECINRKHGTKIDPVIHNSIVYLASKYYVGTMLGCSSMDPEVLRNYCFYNCKNVEFVEIDRIASAFTDEDFANISTFISKLSQIDALKTRLGRLTVSNFIESYINMYDASMLLGLETFSYFFYNVQSVIESTYMNNYGALKNMVGDDGKKLYSDLIVTMMNL